MNNISHLAPILPVRDMGKALTFYKKLGFQEGFLWEEPVTYAVLNNGGNAAVHLSLLDPERRKSPVKSIIYLFMHDVDAMYKRCLDEQIDIHVEIADRDYRMRDFEVLDPDGNLLTFGKGLD
ncbi:MAG: VOC family protein [Bacteroidota bacterium]